MGSELTMLTFKVSSLASSEMDWADITLLRASVSGSANVTALVSLENVQQP